MGTQVITCNHCSGMGTVQNLNSTGPGRITCFKCSGRGLVSEYFQESYDTPQFKVKQQKKYPVKRTSRTSDLDFDDVLERIGAIVTYLAGGLILVASVFVARYLYDLGLAPTFDNKFINYFIMGGVGLAIVCFSIIIFVYIVIFISKWLWGLAKKSMKWVLGKIK